MLSRFPNRTLKVGAKVSLSPESTWMYMIMSNNTVTNPRGVVGTVYSIHNQTGWLRVKWFNDSGEEIGDNGYRLSEYDLIAEGEPGFLET